MEDINIKQLTLAVRTIAEETNLPEEIVLSVIEQAIAAYRNLPLAGTSPDGTVRLGTLVTLESATGAHKLIFLGPDGAGVKVTENGQKIVVITPRSPLGQSLLGKLEGDEVVIEANGAKQLFEILSVR